MVLRAENNMKEDGCIKKILKREMYQRSGLKNVVFLIFLFYASSFVLLFFVNTLLQTLPERIIGFHMCVSRGLRLTP